MAPGLPVAFRCQVLPSASKEQLLGGPQKADPPQCQPIADEWASRPKHPRQVYAGALLTDTADPVTGIGRAILAGLLPSRRLRVSTRKVKSPLSRYSTRNDDGRPLTSQNVTALRVCVHIPPAEPSDIRAK